MFIVFEGSNGIGKSSLVKEVAKNIRFLGEKVHETKEPTTTQLGELIRSYESEVKGLPFAYLIAADRYLHIKNEIQKKLDEKMIVISDRYVLSSLVLQRLDGLDLDFIWLLNNFSIKPNLTVLLTGDDKIIEQRLNSRATKTRLEANNSIKEELDLYEQGMLFLERKGYNFMVVNNTKYSIDHNAKIVTNHIMKLVSQR
ncbi:dTMP kinase [Aureispira sp. CCB-QB1]|uniref:dTMP kinase n=1 Tax=Aureispira sp. CCB-QB1 TaxID=1313421 RepID=UPI000697C086|nr:dTMP kinase [Aureispira sp. CCB-QB1]